MNTISNKAFELFEKHRSGETRLSRSAGSFLGQIVTDPQPLTEKQAGWLDKLLTKAGLPALEDGEAN